jgi:carboxyl-terminal processing protease
MFGIVAVLAAIIGAQAPGIKPSGKDQLTARLVVALLENGHIAKPEVNDEVSKKWCRNFLKALDPQKLYFEKADIAEFLKHDTLLDDEIKEGDIKFAQAVFERFLKRSEERLAKVLEMLKEKPDFTVDESIATDPDLFDYPADANEANDRWRKQLKLELLYMKIDKVEDEDAIKRLTIRYKDRDRFFHQFDTNDLLEYYLTALTTTIDPHSSYMGPKNVEDMLQQQLHLSLEGIGASLASEDGYAVVKEIVPGGAADKDGRLQPDDRIVAIQKEDGKEEVDLVQKKLADVVRLIRGPRGTKVRLVVMPEDSKERKVYELTRERIELKEQRAKAQTIEIKDNSGKPLKVGVIGLPTFYGDMEAILGGDPNAVSATKDCKRLLDDFQKQGVGAVLIDLRDNGGGLLHEAITLSGLFIEKGPVVQVKDASGVKPHDDEDETIAYKGPLIVLINRRSASASEIFAGVIRDYDRGLIIGDSSTFGKGTVQSIQPLNDAIRSRTNLGALKLTIQQFYRADGESTQIRGVRPHVHIPSLLDQVDYGEGKMDTALKYDKVEPLDHDRYNHVPNELVALLQARSDERRKDSDKFKKQLDLFKKVAERKARHSISLNEKTFRAEYVPDENEEDAEIIAKTKGKAKKRFTERKVWESDFYDDEVMAIVADYLTLGSQALAATPVRAAVQN